MAKASSEVSQAKDELQDYLGPRYLVEQCLGMSGSSVVFVVRDRESGNIRLATFRGNITPRGPTGQADKLHSQ
jgi:hypothetical protein